MSRASELLERMDGVTLDLDPSDFSSSIKGETGSKLANDPKIKAFFTKVKGYFKNKKFKKFFAALIVIGVPIVIIRKMAQNLRADREFEQLVAESKDNPLIWLDELLESEEGEVVSKETEQLAADELDAAVKREAYIIKEKFNRTKKLSTWITILTLFLGTAVIQSVRTALKKSFRK